MPALLVTAPLPDITEPPAGSRAAPGSMPLLVTAPLPDITEPPAGSGSVWVPSGGSIFVAGRYVHGGMVYVADGSEPRAPRCSIWTDLPVDWGRPDPTGGSMWYAPTYSRCLPAERAAYLYWLIGGRCDPGACIGYVFLFYYGLERRLFDDLRTDCGHPEAQLLLAEVERLAGIYRTRSFARYSSQLLDFYAGLRAAARADPPPPRPPPGCRRSGLLAGVGRFLAAGAGVPAHWALEYLTHHLDFRRRAAARNCPDVFGDLFILRFEARWGDSIEVRGPLHSRLMVKCSVASSWSAHTGPHTASVCLEDVPNPDESGLFHTLAGLAEECSKDLAAYSRHAGAQPCAAATAAALAKLPRDLLAVHDVPLLRGLRSIARTAVPSAGCAPFLWDDLMAVCFPQQAGPGPGGPPSRRAGSVPKREAESVAVLLERLGVGIEPDVRGGAPTPRPGSDVMLFRLPDGDTGAGAGGGVEYQTAMLAARLAAFVAGGRIADAQARRLDQHAETVLGLDTAQRTRLNAHLRAVAAGGPTLAGVAGRAGGLSSGRRCRLADFLVAVAVADGQISVAEITALAKAFEAVGLSGGDVYRRLHAHSTGSAAGRRDLAPPPGGGVVRLDPDRVRARMADTARVEALLSEIFAGHDDADTTTAADPAAAAVFGGLDEAHSALAAAAAAAAAWTRADLEAVASRLGLPFLDGALAEINEAAAAACGEPLIEGDDPLHTNRCAIGELL